MTAITIYVITNMCTQTGNMDYWTGDLSQAHLMDR